jgi:hypothetical protein
VVKEVIKHIASVIRPNLESIREVLDGKAECDKNPNNLIIIRKTNYYQLFNNIMNVIDRISCPTSQDKSNSSRAYSGQHNSSRHPD